MVIVSCTTKFHSFDLAEQLAKNDMLTGLYTCYHSQKNTLINRFHHRQDREEIPLDKIYTCPPIAIGLRKLPQYEYNWNNLFDKYVAWNLNKRSDFKAFIGWSGMSLNTLLKIKSKGKLTIIERGSSHIQYQDRINNEEYKLQLGLDVNIDKRIINKELREYEEADYISIPSMFVKRSFIEYGVPEEKLFYNPYGVSPFFNKAKQKKKDNIFRIIYLGHMGICKGLLYMFEALNEWKVPISEYEVWFIGGMSDEIKDMYDKYKKSNWKYHGFIEHLKLPDYLNQCDVAIQPSVQEGLSRVIPQMLGCGIPVIASVNSGGEDVIEEGKSGFLVPIRNSKIIQIRLEELFFNRNRLEEMKTYSAQVASSNLSWDKYGKRYESFIRALM